jgi:hypothetical protein
MLSIFVIEEAHSCYLSVSAVHQRDSLFVLLDIKSNFLKKETRGVILKAAERKQKLSSIDFCILNELL